MDCAKDGKRSLKVGGFSVKDTEVVDVRGLGVWTVVRHLVD